MKAMADSDWRDGFLFLGNQLVLDFINTRPVMNGEPVELLPDFDAILRWFQAAGSLGAGDAERMRQQFGGSRRARRVVEAARELREKLREEILRWEGGAEVRRPMLAELNRLMEERPMRKRLVHLPGGLRVEPWFRLEQPEDLFAPLAESAVSLFTGVSHDRVRKCPACVLHFHDTSKKGTRRWCSMRLCGNRQKVAAYAARQRN